MLSLSRAVGSTRYLAWVYRHAQIAAFHTSAVQKDGIPPTPEPGEPAHRMSDNEWEMQTGRAIYVLTQNLPHFFDLGLIDGIDLMHRRTALGLRSLYPRASHDQDGEGAVYSPNIRLEYSPPSTLPVLPRTFWVEGLPMYIASSVFVRHTLKALYTGLSVEPTRMRVSAGSSSPSSAKRRREKSLFVGMKVSGMARVTSTLNEWDVHCTYRFNPESGLIDKHTVNSIEPAPHESFYEALGGLGLGLHGTALPGGPAARTCPIPIEEDGKCSRG